MLTYFPKFSPSSIVSGNSEFMVSGKRKHKSDTMIGKHPNSRGGNQGSIDP